jgi:hypothetical protein
MIHTLSVHEVVNEHIVTGSGLHRRLAEPFVMVLGALCSHVLLAQAGHMSTEVLGALLDG